MLILGLLGMYFNATVVFVTSLTLLFRLALAILCYVTKQTEKVTEFKKILYTFRETSQSTQ